MIRLHSELVEYMLNVCAEYAMTRPKVSYDTLREVAFKEMDSMMNDVLEEFTLDDVLIEAQDKCIEEIKELMWEREGVSTTFQREDEIDREIDELEKRIEELGYDDEDN